MKHILKNTYQIAITKMNTRIQIMIHVDFGDPII